MHLKHIQQHTLALTHTPLTTISERGPGGSSTVISLMEQKTLGFGTAAGLTLTLEVLGGIGDTEGVIGAGVSGAV